MPWVSSAMDSTLFLEVTDLVCLEEPMVEDKKEVVVFAYHWF